MFMIYFISVNASSGQIFILALLSHLLTTYFGWLFECQTALVRTILLFQ